MKVELLSHFGDDLMCVNAARVSFGKNKEVFDEKDEKLIKYLFKHKHTSVFRHPQLQFRITCSIYVERQLFKHQSGMSANSISSRYVDFSDDYTLINRWRAQSKDSKQGSAGDLSEEAQTKCDQIEYDIVTSCKKAYKDLLELGVSKEQARTILPLNLNTTFIWTGSLLAFFHLFNLRLKDDAQKETRDVAMEMLEALKSIKGNPFKHSLAAFSFANKS